MATMIVPFAFAVIGALAYALSTNAKIAELGRILFFAGALALAIALSTKTFAI